MASVRDGTLVTAGSPKLLKAEIEDQNLTTDCTDDSDWDRVVARDLVIGKQNCF